jgi:hypothetical protein
MFWLKWQAAGESPSLVLVSTYWFSGKATLEIHQYTTSRFLG